MKLNYFTLLTSIFLLLPCINHASELKRKLNTIPHVVKVESLKTNDAFSEKYLIWIEQPIDHSHPNKGKFLQRVVLSHKDFVRPMVMITEGYGAAYALRKSYINELSELLNANQICIEHRFFDKSIPDSIEWKYLTTRNAAMDLHRVNQVFKALYNGKWIATGISKGGQTAILYKSYYPEDVSITVPYVAPVNFGLEDGRHEPFINNVASKEARVAVLSFQQEVLKRRDTLQEYFNQYCKDQNYTFTIPLDEVFDYCVLEYSFAFWQWGGDYQTIPSPDAPDADIFEHFLKNSSPDYFSTEGTKSILPFFVQAAHELGYYGYDLTPFKPWLHIKSSHNYVKKIFLPESFDLPWKRTMRWSNRIIQKKGFNMLYIYGEYDPWTATGIVINGRTNALKLVKPGGSHRTRINTLPSGMKQQAMDSLSVWLAR